MKTDTTYQIELEKLQDFMNHQNFDDADMLVTRMLEQYNKLDFSISKSQALSKVLLTYYLQANNLLNDTIRFSTTVDTLRLYAPQPGRALIVGIKVDY